MVEAAGESMITRTWTGAVGDWNTDANWTPAAADDVPAPGDTAIITSGTVILTTNESAKDGLFENNALMLGGADDPTLLLRDPAPIGRFFSLTLEGSAVVEADGVRGIAGSITGDPNDGSALTFEADTGGDLVLLKGGSFNVTDREIDFDGDVTMERNASVSGNVVNNGTLSILQGTTILSTNSLSGTGTIDIGQDGALDLGGNGFGGAGQTIAFSGVGGTLDIFELSGNFTGTITGFAPGDFLDFIGDGSFVSGSVDDVAHTLTLHYSGGEDDVLNNFFGAAGALSAVHETNGHDLIGYASANPQLKYQIDAGALAMHADVVHQMDAPGTATPITGVGVKIGIISDSYNINGGAATDVANGYLPASGVTVLGEGPAGGTDEGRAMAELIYQTAPGASLYFDSTGDDDASFAASVHALQTAGCTVIVDDIDLGDEPFFQLGSAAENAISSAITAGVTYVSSAGNFGDAYYQHAFTTSSQTLFDGSAVQAMTFSNGTPYQSVTASGGSFDTITLQWNASYYAAGGAPDSITIKAFDSDDDLVATSSQVEVNGQLVAATELDLPGSNSTTTYNIAIYQNSGTPAVSEIKYNLIGEGASGGTSVGGRINDPDAGTGDGEIAGHPLIAGEIAVGAADVANTPATDTTPDFTDYFSSTGPGELLFDANGNPLPQPVTVGSPDVVGPDGIDTSVSGFAPFYGTSAAAPNVAAVAALVQQVNPGLSPAQLASILEQSATPLSSEPASVAGAGLVQADRAIQLAETPACYCAGTLIRTSLGERPIEALQIGDLVVTACGAERPVKWLGHRRIDVAKHPRPQDVRPVRIAADAFGDDLPRRELWVSPGHNIAWNGVLVPAIALLNGHSVAQLAVGSVEYWHVELDAHDVLLAEGLPAESYLDADNRTAFENGGAFIEAHPDFAPKRWVDTCLPLANQGPEVERTKALLLARLAERGHEVVEEADAHVVVDGLSVSPMRLSPTRLAFVLPEGGRDIQLRSKTFVPAEVTPESMDRRELGLCIGRLDIDGERVEPCGAPGLGWREPEIANGRFRHRWTSGATPLPSGARIVIVELAGFGKYWRSVEEEMAARLA
jgi:Hint domain/Subtilase family